MTQMLERAARAVGDVVGYRGDDIIATDSLAMDIARAVLMAVREPDDAMQLAGYEYAPNQREQFTAMIDAILAGDA